MVRVREPFLISQLRKITWEIVPFFMDRRVIVPPGSIHSSRGIINKSEMDMRPNETMEIPTRYDVYLNVQSGEIRLNKFPSSIGRLYSLKPVEHAELDDKTQFLLINVYKLS